LLIKLSGLSEASPVPTTECVNIFFAFKCNYEG